LDARALEEIEARAEKNAKDKKDHKKGDKKDKKKDDKKKGKRAAVRYYNRYPLRMIAEQVWLCSGYSCSPSSSGRAGIICQEKPLGMDLGISPSRPPIYFFRPLVFQRKLGVMWYCRIEI
jgi:hypothetical protein